MRPKLRPRGTFVLVQLIKEQIKTPVIAAGGIVSGKSITAALALGADAVQIGTAFLACAESNATSAHRQMLFSENARRTTLSRSYTGRLGRMISNRITGDLSSKPNSYLPFPLQSQFMSHLRKAAVEQEKWDMIQFWSGQIAPVLKHTKAADLMQALLEETTAYFDDSRNKNALSGIYLRIHKKSHDAPIDRNLNYKQSGFGPVTGRKLGFVTMRFKLL